MALNLVTRDGFACELVTLQPGDSHGLLWSALTCQIEVRPGH